MIKKNLNFSAEGSWHLFDAKGKILGRLASKIVPVLIGKNKPDFVRNLDCGDNVVVVNSVLIEVTGRKEQQKKYTAYSGYPGGLKTRTFAEIKKRNPNELIEHAVAGMLPKNKLTKLWLKKLHVFSGSDHDFKDKFKVQNEMLKVKEK